MRIGPFCVVTMSADLVIGDFECVSHGARVLSSSDDLSGGRICGPMVPPHRGHVVAGWIEFGRHAVLGANSVILPGGGLGEGTTVGALSLVKTLLEPWTVNAGVPTRVVGRRDRAGVLADEGRLVGEVRRRPGN